MSSMLVRSVPRSMFTLGRRGGRIAWLLALGALGALVVGVIVGPRRFGCGMSKHDITRLTVENYADEAYPQFRLAHPNRACPADLYELNPWMNSKDIRDPYGTPYRMYCGTGEIIVRSAGEDATFGTADDVWSDR